MTTHYDDDNNEYDDELLRHYYEKELAVLRRDMRTFAERYPDGAARLSINSDGRSDDAGVERVMQSAALMQARHRAKIDDDYPELSESLIRLTYPQSLRAFPSCSIAQFDAGGLFDRLTEPMRIARGTPLKTNIGGCSFRTTYDVVLAPVQITRAQYAATPAAPPSAALPADASGMLSVTFRSAKRGSRLGAGTPPSLRIHLAGQSLVVAALFDTLLLRTACAYVEDGRGHWTRLADVPLKMAGFGPQEWLFTDANEPGQAFGLLGEYFAFAPRFHFVDVDLASLCVAAPGEALTLHLIVAGVQPDSRAAQQLAHLSADHLKLFCTPVVNVFHKEGMSLKRDLASGAWPIEAYERNEAFAEVWSIDRVCTEQGVTLASSDALMTSHASHARPKWTLIQRRDRASPGAGRIAALRLMGADGPIQAGFDSLEADVTCTNGDLPCSVPVGAPAGDIRMEGTARATTKITLLHTPTSVARLSRVNGALWRLIGWQSPHALQLTQAGLPALKLLLQQFAALSPPQARHIDGIRGLRHRSVMTLVARAPQPAMVRGIEITLDIDEQSFIANSVALFARVMEQFFAPYAPANSFVQLIVKSTSGFDLWRGELVTGTSPLL